MICSNCGADTAQIHNLKCGGKETKLTLCSDCFRKLYGENEKDFFTSFLGNVRGKRGKACPTCGTTLDDFRRTGLMGCADCYRAFREEILPTVRFIHGKVQHEGREPSVEAGEKYAIVRDLVREQETLKAELEQAIREGNFSVAESLKERLLEINHKLYRGEEA